MPRIEPAKVVSRQQAPVTLYRKSNSSLFVAVISDTCQLAGVLRFRVLRSVRRLPDCFGPTRNPQPESETTESLILTASFTIRYCGFNELSSLLTTRAPERSAGGGVPVLVPRSQPFTPPLHFSDTSISSSGHDFMLNFTEAFVPQRHEKPVLMT